MSTKIQVRRDTAANWTSANPVLLRGEIAFEYDTKKVKIGDGTLAWNSLPYALVSQTMVQDLVDEHANLTNNPHAVTKAQVGLGNADNTSDANKPISTATQAGLDLKASLTYVDSGLSTKANASDVYTKTQSDSTFEPKNANIQSHISSTSNPHSVTKSQVGLGNVDNTSDANKPISTATQSALDLKASLTYVDSGLSGKADLDGSGKVPVSQLPNSVMEYKGAYNPVTNTPALADGVGNAGDVYRISAAGSKNFGSGSITFFAGDFIIYSGSVWERSPLADGVVSVNGYQGAVSLTKSDIGLGNVPNVDATLRANHTGTQLASTISDFESATEALVLAGIALHTAAADPHSQYETSAEAQAKVDAHANLTNNPHSTTKAQVGLGNVDNTSDANKPVSTATQSALDLKASLTYVDAGLSAKADASSVYTKTQSDANFEPKNANIQSHIASLSNPHSVTKSQVGLGNVPNVDATLRSNHTGTQLAETISDFTAAVQAVTIDAAKIDGGVVSNTEFAYLDGVTSPIQTQLNAKQPTGDYLTALTGDVSASGPGSATATLSATGVAAGSYTKVTVDTKGRVTAGDVLDYYYVSSVQSTNTSNNTFSAVTGLTTDTLQPGLYEFKFQGQYQSAALTTGIAVRISTGTATVTTCYGKWFNSQAADGTAKNFQVDQLSSTTAVPSTASAAVNSNANVTGEGIFRVTVAGTMQIQIRSEINNSQVLIQPDAVLLITKIA